MLVRDVVTNESSISSDSQYQPKELAVKPLPKSHAVQYVDVMEYCSKLEAADATEDMASLSASTVTSHTSMRSSVKVPSEVVSSTLPVSPDSPAAEGLTAAAHLFPAATAPAVSAVIKRSDSQDTDRSVKSIINSKENVVPQLNLESDNEMVPTASKSDADHSASGIAMEADQMAAMFESESIASSKAKPDIKSSTPFSVQNIVEGKLSLLIWSCIC